MAPLPLPLDPTLLRSMVSGGSVRSAASQSSSSVKFAALKFTVPAAVSVYFVTRTVLPRHKIQRRGTTVPDFAVV